MFSLISSKIEDKNTTIDETSMVSVSDEETTDKKVDSNDKINTNLSICTALLKSPIELPKPLIIPLPNSPATSTTQTESPTKSPTKSNKDSNDTSDESDESDDYDESEDEYYNVKFNDTDYKYIICIDDKPFTYFVNENDAKDFIWKLSKNICRKISVDNPNNHYYLHEADENIVHIIGMCRFYIFSYGFMFKKIFYQKIKKLL